MSGDSNGAVGVELYKKHRPVMFKYVFGQDGAVRQLEKFLEDGTLPHSLLFTGPSGVGKTTLCRILKRKLGCGDQDYQEVNCAAVEGAIETVRDIQSRMSLAPWRGACRIWLLDEVQSFSRAGFAQQALLKMLEDTPKHVYFFLATTNPDKLIKTIHTRCTKIELGPLSHKALRAVLDHACKREGLTLSDRVRDRIVDVADGSGREAMVRLHEAAGYQTEAEQLASVRRPDTEQKAIDLVRALLWERQKPSWKELAAIISGISDGENWEGVRHLILSLAVKEMLKPDGMVKRSAEIVGKFRFNCYDCGKSGLVDDCYTLVSEKE